MTVTASQEPVYSSSTPAVQTQELGNGRLAVPQLDPISPFRALSQEGAPCDDDEVKGTSGGRRPSFNPNLIYGPRIQIETGSPLSHSAASSTWMETVQSTSSAEYMVGRTNTVLVTLSKVAVSSSPPLHRKSEDLTSGVAS